jgi:hypothetical protein
MQIVNKCILLAERRKPPGLKPELVLLLQVLRHFTLIKRLPARQDMLRLVENKHAESTL